MGPSLKPFELGSQEEEHGHSEVQTQILPDMLARLINLVNLHSCYHFSSLSSYHSMDDSDARRSRNLQDFDIALSAVKSVPYQVQ